jgi:hypothetical protein
VTESWLLVMLLMAAGAPPKVTIVVVARLSPVMVTVLPPLAGPELALRPLRNGASV